MVTLKMCGEGFEIEENKRKKEEKGKPRKTITTTLPKYKNTRLFWPAC